MHWRKENMQITYSLSPCLECTSTLLVELRENKRGLIRAGLHETSSAVGCLPCSATHHSPPVLPRPLLPISLRPPTAPVPQLGQPPPTQAPVAESSERGDGAVQLRAAARGSGGVMPGLAAAPGSGIWSRRRDEVTPDRLHKVPSGARS
jgi:hypothetical protein